MTTTSLRSTVPEDMWRQLGESNLLYRLGARFFHDRFYLFIILVGLASLVMPFTLAAASKTLLKGCKLSVGYLNDPAALIGVGLGLPCILLLFRKYCSRLGLTIQALLSSGLFHAPMAEIDLNVRTFIRRANSRWLHVTIPVAIIYNHFWLTFCRGKEGKGIIAWFFVGTNEYLPNAQGLYYTFLVSLLVYVCLHLVIYSVLIGLLLWKLCTKSQPLIRPLHPDGVGGLASVANLAATSAYPIIAGGVILCLAIVSDVVNFDEPLQSRLHAAYIVTYFVLATLLFYSPLISFHEPMQSAKDKILNELRVASKQEEERFVLQLRSDNLPTSKALDGLRGVYNVAMQMPVWPFNTRYVIRFIIIIISPIWVALAGRLVSWLLSGQPSQ
jgi:hypothetical protein